MTDRPESGNELADEIRRLGENLKENLQAIWDHPDTKEVRGEVKQGLHELGDTITQLSKDFSESPTGQRLQSGVDDFGEKVRSGEAETKVRQEFIRVLDNVNIELEKVRQSWSESSDQDTDQTE